MKEVASVYLKSLEKTTNMLEPQVMKGRSQQSTPIKLDPVLEAEVIDKNSKLVADISLLTYLKIK